MILFFKQMRKIEKSVPRILFHEIKQTNHCCLLPSCLREIEELSLFVFILNQTLDKQFWNAGTCLGLWRMCDSGFNVMSVYQQTSIIERENVRKFLCPRDTFRVYFGFIIAINLHASRVTSL